MSFINTQIKMFLLGQARLVALMGQDVICAYDDKTYFNRLLGRLSRRWKGDRK